MLSRPLRTFWKLSTSRARCLTKGAGFEATGQFMQDGVHGGGHALLELLALTGRQGKQARPVGVIEVVDIDQTGGVRPFAGLRAKIGEQGIAAPQIGIARRT